ncbi:uncharacterized protein LOC117886002 [Trachemys scripta elegans]|uniref:uncharacterized protein LOC117886002 n=1 Tax=Trachemys scripta elegans TaxID=31138 RepID=UPI001551ACF9|nr:uncharacterized protein LOC117886002 [Trachemys scripta elegans]
MGGGRHSRRSEGAGSSAIAPHTAPTSPQAQPPPAAAQGSAAKRSPPRARAGVGIRPQCGAGIGRGQAAAQNRRSLEHPCLLPRPELLSIPDALISTELQERILPGVEHPHFPLKSTGVEDIQHFSESGSNGTTAGKLEIQLQRIIAESVATKKDSAAAGETPPTGILFRPSLPSGNTAIWLLTRELQQVMRENQSLRQHVEDLTKKVSAMESRLAHLEQAPAPDVTGLPTGTVLIPKVGEIQIPLAEMDEMRVMDCEETEINLPAGHPEAMESGEVSSTPEGQSQPHKPPAAASIPNSSLLRISPKEDRRLFEKAEGDIAKYALAVFRHTMPRDYYQQWRGKVNVSGTHQKAALSPNLVNAAFKAAKRRKPNLAGKDYSNIKIQINNLMRSRKSRSLVESTGQR